MKFLLVAGPDVVPDLYLSYRTTLSPGGTDFLDSEIGKHPPHERLMRLSVTLRSPSFERVVFRVIFWRRPVLPKSFDKTGFIGLTDSAKREIDMTKKAIDKRRALLENVLSSLSDIEKIRVHGIITCILSSHFVVYIDHDN